MTYESVEGPGLSTPPGGPVHVTTKTGYAGAYAFIDMPVAAGGTCYRLVVTEPGLGAYQALDVNAPDSTTTAASSSTANAQGSHLETTSGKPVPRLWKACAAQVSR